MHHWSQRPWRALKVSSQMVLVQLMTSVPSAGSHKDRLVKRAGLCRVHVGWSDGESTQQRRALAKTAQLLAQLLCMCLHGSEA